LRRRRGEEEERKRRGRGEKEGKIKRQERGCRVGGRKSRYQWIGVVDVRCKGISLIIAYSFWVRFKMRLPNPRFLR